MNEEALLDDIEYFGEKIGPVTQVINVPDALYDKYCKILPNALMSFWKRFGFSSFSDGLFWITNPADYKELVDLWLENTHYPEIDNYHVIGRTAFGELYLWGEKNNQSITISCSNIAIIALEDDIRKPKIDPDLGISVLFSTKKKKSFDMKDEANNLLFNRALDKLGPLEVDEMYGFEPFLFTGGKLSLDYLSKVKLEPHLTIARQLGGLPRNPFFDVRV